jgi:hypothetical protein
MVYSSPATNSEWAPDSREDVDIVGLVGQLEVQGISIMSS